ncbi:hypothetical protein C2E21_8605 [Chlorella sorokiniana]|uniref:PA14 domain-containing protein n=1 Tax=Chlorella sorokiniana TaxID=3076 RepID=A0A2P6TDW7_CHLSO|nr:hypothetical protein C2E21_8605 [Chlorella sorokiniana]|eukprot:PRW20834.1 hypothetical protein C2E21_8605 [Chlorella sorokiniana]
MSITHASRPPMPAGARRRRPCGAAAPLLRLACRAALLALLLLAAPQLAAADAGLTRELYHMAGVTSLPVPYGTPSGIDVVPTLNCAPAANCYPAPTQAVIYGYILIGSGTYNFYLGSRDGASVEIGGVAVVSNPGGSGWVESSAAGSYTSGWQYIEIQYVSATAGTGNNGLTLPPSPPPPSPPSIGAWTQLPGTAMAVSLSYSGHLWGCGAPAVSKTCSASASEGLAMWWDPYGSGWQQWNGGTCTNVAAARDGSAYITNDCGTVYHSGADPWAAMYDASPALDIALGLDGTLYVLAWDGTSATSSSIRWLRSGVWAANGAASGAVRLAADWKKGYAVTTDHSVQQYDPTLGFVTRFSRVACDLAFDSWGTPWFVAWTGASCSGVFYYNNATGVATQVYWGPANQLTVGARDASGSADLAVLLADGTVWRALVPCTVAPPTATAFSQPSSASAAFAAFQPQPAAALATTQPQPAAPLAASQPQPTPTVAASQPQPKPATPLIASQPQPAATLATTQPPPPRPPLPPSPPPPPGLLVQVYPITDQLLTDFPDWATRPPPNVTWAASIDCPTMEECFWEFQQENVAALFTGWLHTPASGTYTFTLESDDGSRLLLDGTLAVDNGGEHGWWDESASIWLAAGWHHLRLEFFNGGGDGDVPTPADKFVPAPPTVDTDPPVLRLLGGPELVVQQGQLLQQAPGFGATAVDGVDGAITAISFSGLQAVNTSQAGRYSLTYSAADRAGNVASASQTIVVRSPCTAPERLCLSSCSCSSFGVCLGGGKPCPSVTVAAASMGGSTPSGGSGSSGGSSGGSGSGSTGAAAAVDTTPPVIILGNASCAPGSTPAGSTGVSNVRALTAAGMEVVLTSVPVGCAFWDNLTVWDAVDGNLTAGASSFGAAAVDTSAPTWPGQPYVITYQAADAAGNQATPKQRRVAVVCPLGEAPCNSTSLLAAMSGRAGSGKPYCSSQGGMCLGPTPAAAAGSAGTGTSGSAAAPLPQLELIGPEVVYVPAGQPYSACPPSPPANLLCDRGATAWQQQDGSLTPFVEACSSGSSRLLFAASGLSGCNISTATPGVRTVTFSVTDSLGRRATANRTLLVQQQCAAGERRCADQVTCSTGGTCLADLASPGSTGSAPLAAPPAAAPQPPTIQLFTTPALPAALSIRQGSSYAACAPGQQPSKELPCELGATAAFGGTNLTAAVLACPPPSCLGSTRCPQALFSSRGLAPCTIDTSQPIGTVIQIPFVMWSTAQPALNASATRTLVIAPPCDPGLYPCPATGSKTVCSGVPCALLATLLPQRSGPLVALVAPAAPPPPPPPPPLSTSSRQTPPARGVPPPPPPAPQLQLQLQREQVVVMRYGQPPEHTLLPCSTAAAAAGGGCRAVAYDATGNDLSSDISVTDATCSGAAAAASDTLCWPCDLSAAQQGTCLPGRYTLNFTVVDDGGVSATAQLRLLLVQRFSLAATVSLFPGADPGNAAEATAAAVAAAAEAVAGNATLLRQLAVAFNASLAPTLQPLQLNITAASTSQASVGSTSAVAGAASEAAAAVAAAGPARSLTGQQRRLAQAPAPAPEAASSTPALQLSFSLEALSPNPLLYAGGTAPTVPAAAASHLLLQSIDAAFADSLQQTAAAACAALAAVLAANPATAAALQGAGGSFSCSPPEQMGSVEAITPAVSFDAASWLPVLSALGAADQQLQALRAALAAFAAAADAGQHLAAVASAWGALMTAYNGSQLSLPELQAVAASLQTAAPLLGLPVLTTSAAAAVQRSQYAALTSLSGINLFSAGLLAEFSSQSSYCQQQGSGSGASRLTFCLDTHTGAGCSASEAAVGERASGRRQYIGSRGSNVLIGGLFLHQRRRAVPTLQQAAADCSARFVNLTFRCQYASALEAAAAAGINTSYLAPAAEGQQGAGELPPAWGVDPAVLESSALHYAPLAYSMGLYYNTSPASPDLNHNRQPFGFQPRVLPHFPPGGPLVLETSLSQDGAARVLRYLRDGSFLDDAQSASLDVRLLTYNPALDVLGYFRGRIQWEAAGHVAANCWASAMPIASFTPASLRHSGGNRQRLAANVLLGVLVAARAALLLRRLLRKLRAQQRSAAGTAVALMLLALVLLSASLAVEQSFDVRVDYTLYDAANHAKAHMLLTNRAEPGTDTATAALSALAAADSATAAVGAAATVPGGPARWLLPAADAGFDEFASALAAIDTISTLDTLSSSVQGIVLMLMVVRLMWSLTAQRRLSVITRTITQSAGALAHLLLLTGAVVTLLVAAGVLVLGDLTPTLGDLPTALRAVFEGFLVGDLRDVVRELREAGAVARLNPVQSFTSVLWLVLLPVLSLFILRQFVLAVMLDEFSKLKRQAGNVPGIAADVAALLRERGQVVAQGAPTNAELLELWQHVAPPVPVPSAGPSRKASRLSRLLTRATPRSSGASGGASSGRFARWLSTSSAGRSVSRLLGLPASSPQQAAGQGGAAAGSQGGTAGPGGEAEVDGIPVMEVAGDTVDLDGLTLVLSAANAAAGGELAPLEVQAAARAIMRRFGQSQVAAAAQRLSQRPASLVPGGEAQQQQARLLAAAQLHLARMQAAPDDATMHVERRQLFECLAASTAAMVQQNEDAEAELRELSRGE